MHRTVLMAALLAGCAPTYVVPEHESNGSSQHQFRSSEAIARGVTLDHELPFQSFTYALTADPETSFEFRYRSSGTWSPWLALPVSEDLGLFRNGEVTLPKPVGKAQIRGTNGVATFLAADVHEGARPSYEDDNPSGDGLETAQAKPGMWTMPSETWDIGQGWYLSYYGATHCTGSLTSGASALGNYLVANFEATTFQGYNCRTIGGSSTLSVHASGRAIDVFVPMDGWTADSADNDLGDPIANWLVENAEHIGISYMVWDRASWGAHRSGDKHRAYTGVHPHNDHLHIELNPDAANMSTPFFTSGGLNQAPSPSEDTYLVGDWNGDGKDNIAVRRGSTVLQDTDFAGENELTQTYGLGDTEDEYLVGDWDGSGTDNLAVRRGPDVLMDWTLDGYHDRLQAYGWGQGEDEYLVGDWDGDGVDNVAVRRGNLVLMDTDFDGTHNIAQAYGSGGDHYLVGDWDGDGRDNLAVRRGGTLLMDTNFDGAHDIEQVYGLGDAEDEYLVGDWDGDGDDDIAVRRGNEILMSTDGDAYHDLSFAYGEDPTGAQPPSGFDLCWPGSDRNYDACTDLAPATTVGYTYPSALSANYQPPSNYVDLTSLSPDLYVAPNFKLKELAQESKGRFGVVQVHAVEQLQNIRDALGSIIVNSGYRNPSYNTGVGGATWSRHMYGDAFDIRGGSASLSAVESECRALGAGWVGVYTSHVHCDWRNDSQEPAFFGGPSAPPPAPSPAPSALVGSNGGQLIALLEGWECGDPLQEWTAFDEDGNVLETYSGDSYDAPSDAASVELSVGRAVTTTIAL